MNCAVCGSGPAFRKLRKGHVDILECPSCGLCFWVPEAAFRPELIYDDAYFASPESHAGYDDYSTLEASLRLTFARRLARIPRARPCALLLDVGAALGFAADEARRAGWNSIALEVSQSAAKRVAPAVRKRMVIADSLTMPFSTSTFDVVTMWDVLEHLRDPHSAVAEVARVLRPGGRFVLTTGDVRSAVACLSRARWHLYTIPEHLFFYSRKSLRLLLSAHGFSVTRLQAEGAIYSLGYLVERLRKSLLGREESKVGRWPGWQLRIPVNLFDIVTVEATRQFE